MYELILQQTLMPVYSVVKTITCVMTLPLNFTSPCQFSLLSHFFFNLKILKNMAWFLFCLLFCLFFSFLSHCSSKDLCRSRLCVLQRPVYPEAMALWWRARLWGRVRRECRYLPWVNGFLSENSKGHIIFGCVERQHSLRLHLYPQHTEGPISDDIPCKVFNM